MKTLMLLMGGLFKNATCQHEGACRTDETGQVWQICTKCAQPVKLDVNLLEPAPNYVGPTMQAA